MRSAGAKSEATLYAAPVTEVPDGFVKVVRWVGAGEAEMWANSGLAVPPGLHGDERFLPVAQPMSPQPPGTGPFRVEFYVPQPMLVSRPQIGWLYLLVPAAGLGVLNLRILGPAESPGEDHET